ncbi:hypothetical protein DPMN_150092 [Dreissena polymorpha]|uniref:Uncharacterized protein n=1 Tax=Dreissena polymorpha TaxID=45954 RepID=A0A9D4FCT5_DREPO|nr:hypothetical protein DPMN_150092 [Dreissena polymorpha]
MSNRKACEQWMSSVEKSGSFQAWLERQNKHRENESLAGNNKAACDRWIKSMGRNAANCLRHYVSDCVS